MPRFRLSGTLVALYNKAQDENAAQNDFDKFVHKEKEEMMKKIILVVGLLVGFGMFIAVGAANAVNFTFNDNTVYWGKTTSGYEAGWDSTKAWASSDSGDNSTESIGYPEFPTITAGGGTINDSGNLTEIYFNYSKPIDGWLHAGDVFIDVGADNNWDYVIVSAADTPDDSSKSPGWSKGVYEVKDNLTFSAFKGGNDSYYLLSDDYWSGGFRNDHPVTASSYAPLQIIDTCISFVDFNTDTTTPVSFSGLDGIFIGDSPFIIAFAPTCANDVIREQVPEPGTMLLLGLGLVGMAFVGRKKVVRSKGNRAA